MDKSEFVSLLKEEVKGLSSYLDTNDYRNAADDASRETGWSFPQTGDFEILWLKQRAKRHLFFYLLSESAHKFKVDQINLQHRFEHYHTIIKQMDADFMKIVEERPDKFAGEDVFKLFGTRLTPGFSYDQYGRETTYYNDNEVDFTPTEDD